MLCLCEGPFIPIPVPMQEALPALGQAPDLMTNPQMAALVSPVDAALLFPFYAEVNINNAKFKWYKTGKLEHNSKSFYAVCLQRRCVLSVVRCLLVCLSCHPSTLVPS